MIEHELRDLAVDIDLPVERNLAPAVRARIGSRRPRPGKLAIALALVVLAVTVALAVPPARSEIRRWLGLGTARVEFVDRLPDVQTRRPLEIGPKTSLNDARERVPYDVVTSSLLGAPREVHLLGDQVGFVYGKHKLLVLQSRGTYFQKDVGPETSVEHLELNGREALWISGGRHYFAYVERDHQARAAPLYLAGKALIWTRGDLTLRLEGKLSRAEALRIARSFG
ncbi:MAG: hypothetical protein ACJ74P_13830 [Gaiellaceae bacterium]